MKKIILSVMLAAAAFSASCTRNSEITPDAPLTPVTFEKVKVEDDFWLSRMQIQKAVLVPFALEKTEPAVENLRRTGNYIKDGKIEPLLPLKRYVSSDLYKVMEGAAYLLTLGEDPELEKRMDDIIDVIERAQNEHGYLFEIHLVHPSMSKKNAGTGFEPYTSLSHSHELYNMGHMYEAAVAYYRATGKRKFLDIAMKNVHHIDSVIFKGHPAYNDGEPVNQPPGHQEIELALVKMYQATGDSLCLDMARKFIDIRGVHRFPIARGHFDDAYFHQHIPVREQREAVGHSVRALYLYSGMADVMGEFNDSTLWPALDAIWHDIADTKIHITGGLGSVRGIEGFGPAYELPNKDTYDETCAAVGNVFFNYRMFLATGEARYVDMAEISLYNNVLAGVNLEGNRFFYVNVLESDGTVPFNHGRAGRSPWFSTACCPSNLARLIPQVQGMVYSHSDDDIVCGFYAGSSVTLPLSCGNVSLKQETDYPYDGKISFDVEVESPDSEFTLWLRVPTWARDRFMPGELYSYAGGGDSDVSVRVNGRKFRAEVVDGYIPVERVWNSGDKVELVIDMPVCFSVADERVEADRNRMCVTRGPLVYCAEGPDNEHPAYRYIVSDPDCAVEFDQFDEGVMKGIGRLSLDAAAVNADDIEVPSKLTLIPYFSWNNRGDGTTLNVWFARDAQTLLSVEK